MFWYLSAQDLETVFPEMVYTDAEGYKTVDYSRLTPVLVEAVKAQQFQIDELKSIIEEQNRKMEALIQLVLNTTNR